MRVVIFISRILFQGGLLTFISLRCFITLFNFVGYVMFSALNRVLYYQRGVPDLINY